MGRLSIHVPINIAVEFIPAGFSSIVKLEQLNSPSSDVEAPPHPSSMKSPDLWHGLPPRQCQTFLMC